MPKYQFPIDIVLQMEHSTFTKTGKPYALITCGLNHDEWAFRSTLTLSVVYYVPNFKEIWDDNEFF